jgi:hypothetical protein
MEMQTMTDLVTRLQMEMRGDRHADLAREAADEIERLTAAVKTIEHSSRCNGGGFISKNSLLDVVRRHGDIARSALVSKP